MVLFEDGQSRMRVEGLPVAVGLVISVNEIWTEDGVVAVAVAVAVFGFAVFVLSLFKDEAVNVAELGLVGR
jgi:uncharacterized membrane protein